MENVDTSAAEPPKPERGRTAEERGRDVSEAQAAAEAHGSHTRRAVAMMSPRFYFSQAGGYPLLIKWFLWFAMVWVYPVWIVGILVGILFGWLAYVVLLTLFLPLRIWMIRKRPEQYAEWKQRQRKQQQA